MSCKFKKYCMNFFCLSLLHMLLCKEWVCKISFQNIHPVMSFQRLRNIGGVKSCFQKNWRFQTMWKMSKTTHRGLKCIRFIAGAPMRYTSVSSCSCVLFDNVKWKSILNIYIKEIVLILGTSAMWFQFRDTMV